VDKHALLVWACLGTANQHTANQTCNQPVAGFPAGQSIFCILVQVGCTRQSELAVADVADLGSAAAAAALLVVVVVLCRQYDKLTTRQEKPLERTKRAFRSVTTSDDPVIR
jgi:hypothetical protein